MRVKLACLLVLAASATARADEVYGSITRDGRPLAGAAIRIECQGQSYAGESDRTGSYAIYVEQTGRCSFVLPDLDAQAVITSYSSPARYNFDLVGGELRRR